MINSIEDKTIAGVLCRISDGGERSMPGVRYRVWVGGCAISQGEATIEQARHALLTYMEIRLEREMRELKQTLKLKKRAQLKVMKASPRARFRGGNW